MKPVSIPFPLTSMPGHRPQEGAGRLVNCYAEPLGKGARWEGVRRRVPGLTAWASTLRSNPRGMQALGSFLYAAWEDRLHVFPRAGGAGIASYILPGRKPLIWARNNNATPDLMAVDPEAGAFIITDSEVSDFSSADFGQPNSVCFLDGYFFLTFANGQCAASGINVTTVNGLDFITAEAKPDGLLRAIPFNGQLYLFGGVTTEVWGPPVNDTGFPYNRVTVINRGLFGRYAIAGHEDGFGKALGFVGDDCSVYLLGNQYTPEKISPPDLDRLIQQVTDRDELQACVYVADGQPVFVLSSATWTWEFRLNSQKWNERASHNLTRWRGCFGHLAFDKWYMQDTTSGDILAVDSAAKTEDGDPLRVRVESGNVADFPSRERIARIDLDLSMGVGIATGDDPNETDPTLEVSVTHDAGKTWTDPRLKKMGAQARANQRIKVAGMGLSGPQGFRIRIDCSDPVDFALMGGTVSNRLL